MVYNSKKDYFLGREYVKLDRVLELLNQNFQLSSKLLTDRFRKSIVNTFVSCKNWFPNHRYASDRCILCLHPIKFYHTIVNKLFKIFFKYQFLMEASLSKSILFIEYCL